MLSAVARWYIGKIRCNRILYNQNLLYHFNLIYLAVIIIVIILGFTITVLKDISSVTACVSSCWTKAIIILFSAQHFESGSSLLVSACLQLSLMPHLHCQFAMNSICHTSISSYYSRYWVVSLATVIRRLRTSHENKKLSVSSKSVCFS